MTEKRGKRDAIKRKNAKMIAICIIATGLWVSMFFLLISKPSYEIWGLIVFVLGGVALVLLITKFAIGAEDDNLAIQETENMEKAKQILSDSMYTPIRCTINYDGIRGGWWRVAALKSIASTQAEVLTKFNYTLAAKFNEDKICYAIVDESGNEISQVDMYDTVTFFMNNFEKI